MMATARADCNREAPLLFAAEHGQVSSSWLDTYYLIDVWVRIQNLLECLGQSRELRCSV